MPDVGGAPGELGQRVVVGGGQGTTGISGVDDARRLDEQRVDFSLRDRAVLDTARYDEQLPQLHVVSRP